MASWRCTGTQQREASRCRGKSLRDEFQDTWLTEGSSSGRFGQPIEGCCYAMHAELELGVGLRRVGWYSQRCAIEICKGF